MTALTVCSDAYAGNEDFEKGLTHYVKRDYRNAEIYFKKYVSQIPDPAGYYLLGYTDYKLKKFHDASRYFTEAYLIDPDISPKAAHLLKKRNKR
jgi:TolA-binding protein